MDSPLGRDSGGVLFTLKLGMPAVDPNNNEEDGQAQAHDTSAIRVNLTILLQLCKATIETFTDSVSRVARDFHYDGIAGELHRYDFSGGRQSRSFCGYLSSVFSELGMDQTLIESYIARIIIQGRQLIDKECEENPNRREVPLLVSIKKMEYVRRELECTNDGRVGASAEAMKSLKEVVVGEEEKKQMKCGVCLEEVEVGKVGRVMPCDHGFHEDCILKWLRESHHCPLCRYQLPTANIHHLSEGQFFTLM